MKAGALLTILVASLAACQPSPPVASPRAEPLLYARDARNLSLLAGFDWSGKQRVSVPAAWTSRGVPAVFLNLEGRPILDRWQPSWRNENQGCGRAFEHLNTVVASGTSYLRLEACSLQDDRAIVVRLDIGGATDLWAVQPSTGMITSHTSYREPGTYVTASPRGTYIAENTNHAGTVVRSVSDGGVVLRLTPGDSVEGFSDDETRMLTISQPAQVLGLFDTEVIDRSNGRAVWTDHGPETAYVHAVRPGRGDFALALRVPGGPSCGIPPCWLDAGLLVVHADGATSSIPGRYVTDW